ncbi:MAG: hypothetical protein QUS35_09100 [bacterium]|nr:hypothetical protein [bacterium]
MTHSNRTGRRARRAGTLAAATCLALLACTVDHGLEPIRSKISGRVFFAGDANPDITDEVRVAVLKKFPPKDITELTFSEIIFGNSDQPPDTVPWEIYLEPGSYEIAAVIWKAHNQSWNISDIIGMWGGQFIGDQLIPPFPFVPIELKNSRSVVDTIDIRANLNRVNRDGLIEGTLTFTGEWPANTGVVGIGAFSEIPKSGDVFDYLLKNIALDYSVPTFTGSASYRLRVRSTETIKYVALMWINNAFDFGGIRDIGFYRNPANPSQPGSVNLAGKHVTGIDIRVDFAAAFGGGT